MVWPIKQQQCSLLYVSSGFASLARELVSLFEFKFRQSECLSDTDLLDLFDFVNIFSLINFLAGGLVSDDDEPELAEDVK